MIFSTLRAWPGSLRQTEPYSPVGVLAGKTKTIETDYGRYTETNQITNALQTQTVTVRCNVLGKNL